MENIIFLMLFTYPGAFAEFTYRHFAKDRAFYREPETSLRAARIFFLSALTTLICLLIVGGWSAGLPGTIEALKRGNNTFIYAFLSAGVSLDLGGAWYGLSCLWDKLYNRFAEARGEPRRSHNSQTWMSLMANKDVPQKECVFEIRKNGMRIHAGLPLHCPDDLREDSGIALCHCKTVENILDTPDQDLIEQPSAYYLDMRNNIEIIIRGAKKYYEWLESPEADD